jgi:hypothetical protein
MIDDDVLKKEFCHLFGMYSLNIGFTNKNEHIY